MIAAPHAGASGPMDPLKLQVSCLQPASFEFVMSDAEVSDPERLAALESYGILDTEPEEGFDDIVAIAREACAAPVALVSLVAADRQWFKARSGIDAHETPLDQSVCAHTLKERDLLVVPDLTLDPRTRDNPLVVGEPHARFYAGAVLRSPEGQSLGAICVLDFEPRPDGLTDGQTAALLALGRQVMALLNLRRSVDRSGEVIVGQARVQRDRDTEARETRDRELKLQLAVASAQIGIFDFDVETNRLEWDARTRELFGEPPDASITYENSFLAGLHPDDRRPADDAVQAALDPAGSGMFETEYRTMSPDGATTRWIAARGQAIVIDGRTTRLVGTVRDVTGRKTADDRVAATLERYALAGRATNDAIWDWDLVTGHVLWNEAVTAAYGYPLEEVDPTPQWWLDRIHPDDLQRTHDDIWRVIDGTGAEWRHEYRFRRADGHYADVLDRGYMIRDSGGGPRRMIGAMLDLTDRKEAEEQFRAVFEGANVGIVELDPRTGRAIRCNAKLCQIWATTEDEILGHSLARWTPPEDEDVRPAIHERLARGEAIKETIEKRYRRADGEIIWARVNLVSRRLRDGVHATAMIEDITAERMERARQAALLDLASQLRDLSDARSMAAAACDALGRMLKIDRASFGAVDASGSTVEIEVDWRAADVPTTVGRHALDRFGDLAATAAKGLPFAVGDVAADPRTADHRDGYEALGIRSLLHVPVLERGQLVAMFYLHATIANEWSPEVVAFVQAVADRTRAAVARAKAEDRQRLLNNELSHRMKNLLTMVQAIASQTLRGAASVQEVQGVLMGRLQALGRAHDVLLGGATGAATLASLVAGAVELHSNDADRLSVAGPELPIGAKATLPIIMMMHELGTNAAKYGALANDGGRVAVEWAVAGEPGRESIRLVWSESGGPPVSPPARKGFGSRLIERGLAAQMGATVTIEYAPAGLRCVLQAPLARLQESD